MAFFLDEAVRETMQPAGGAVFNLLGAKDGLQAFQSAKRADGTAVQTGDKTCVTCLQSLGGVVIRVISIATLTLGGTNTLTLSTVAYPTGGMFFSTEGASFPTFNTQDTGETFCALAVPILDLYDDEGNALNSQRHRKTSYPADLADFAGQQVIAENEAVFHLGRSGPGFSGAAGLFAQINGSTGTADGVDKLVNPNAGTGRVDRVPIKVAPTHRETAIPAMGLMPIQTIAPWFDLTDSKANYHVRAWDNADRSVYLQGDWQGDPVSPQAYNVIEHADPPLLEFDLAGTTAGLRNNVNAAKTFSLLVERRG